MWMGQRPPPPQLRQRLQSSSEDAQVRIFLDDGSPVLGLKKVDEIALSMQREAERLLFLSSDPKPAIAAALAKFPSASF